MDELSRWVDHNKAVLSGERQNEDPLCTALREFKTALNIIEVLAPALEMECMCVPDSQYIENRVCDAHLALSEVARLIGKGDA